jgi:tetratricopeptide (TPR) repeat protein
MKYVVCDVCDNKDISLNDTIKIDHKVYCSPCFQKNFSDEKSLKGKLIEKEIDPTICSSCHKDFGNLELNKISAYPICEECENKIKNKVFPVWVKGFFLGVIAIVIIGFTWNWKFYQAYNNIKLANKYFQNGDFTTANTLMASASNKVPEVEDLKTLSEYFHGVELLSKDQSEEALAEFNKCKDILPPDYGISSLIIQAKIGISFNNKDYEGFLEASKENLALDSTNPVSLSSVASAYACIYASKGIEDAKQNAIQYLSKARAIDDTSKEARSYYNMIEYRIDSKKIIRREEFDKQFPNGWTKN